MYTQVWDSLLRARAGELRPSVVTQSGPLGFFYVFNLRMFFALLQWLKKIRAVIFYDFCKFYEIKASLCIRFY